MTLEEIMAAFEKHQALVKGAPSAMIRDEAAALAGNEKFQQVSAEAADYYNKLKDSKQLSDSYEKNHTVGGEMLRFAQYHLVPETSPEAKELNDDFMDMLYCSEGQNLLADKGIRATLEGDLAVAYPADPDEAIHTSAEHPFLAEQMFIAVNILSNPRITIDPVVREQFSNNVTAMQNAIGNQDYVNYYATGLACAIGNKPGPADFAAVVGNIPSVKFPQNDSSKYVSLMENMTDITGEKAKLENTVQQLRAEGVIGPESMFYRAFDENGTRINLKQAIHDRADGKKVEFRKMSEEEQQRLREAMKHPTVAPAPSRPGPLCGRELQTECRELYNAMNAADSAFIRSSKEFRDLKKSLKTMAESKNIPNSDDARQFLRKAAQLSSAYLIRKREEKIHNTLSEYGQSRLDVMERVHKALTGKLGVLAYQSYVQKTVVREKAEENQAAISAALDARAEQPVVEQPVVEQPVEKAEEIVFEPAQQEPVNPTRKQFDSMASDFIGDAEEVEELKGLAGGEPSKKVVDGIPDLRDDAAMPFDEETEIDAGFLSDVKPEENTFLKELDDSSAFRKMLEGCSCNSMAKKNIVSYYEKAAAARAELKRKADSGKDEMSAKEMIDIAEYGVIRAQLDRDARYPIGQMMEQMDMNRLERGYLLPENLKMYYAKDHSAKTVQAMLSDTDKLEHTCIGAWTDASYRIYDKFMNPQSNQPQANAAQKAAESTTQKTGSEMSMNKK